MLFLSEKMRRIISKSFFVKRTNSFLFVFLFLSFFVSAQSFDIDQIEQVFRPRIKWDNRFIFPSSFADTTGKFSDFSSSALFTFPIKTKFDTGFELDLRERKIKDILKNSIKIHASQTMGSLRVSYRQTNLGFDSVPVKNFYSISGGFSGIKLDRKFRVVFYNLAVNISEENKTLSSSVPRFSGVLGRLHLKGVQKNYFYGLAFVYSDGLPLPVPFFGGTFPLPGKFLLNLTFPTSVNLQYKSKGTSLFVGASADGFRTGWKYQGNRINLNQTGGQAFVAWRQKIHRTITARIEAGYYFYNALRVNEGNFSPEILSIQPGPYVNAGISILFGKNLIEKILDQMK